MRGMGAEARGGGRAGGDGRQALPPLAAAGRPFCGPECRPAWRTARNGRTASRPPACATCPTRRAAGKEKVAGRGGGRPPHPLPLGPIADATVVVRSPPCGPSPSPARLAQAPPAAFRRCCHRRLSAPCHRAGGAQGPRLGKEGRGHGAPRPPLMRRRPGRVRDRLGGRGHGAPRPPPSPRSPPAAGRCTFRSLAASAPRPPPLA